MDERSTVSRCHAKICHQVDDTPGPPNPPRDVSSWPPVWVSPGEAKDGGVEATSSAYDNVGLS